MNAPFLILDIDGVLVTQNSDWDSHNCCHLFDQPCVLAMQSILTQFNPNVVISSSWRREFRSIEGLKSVFFTQGLEPNIIGATPVIRNASRGEEIEAWFVQNNVDVFNARIAVVDDDSDIAPFQRHWIQTTWQNGFTHQHIPLVQRLFRTTVLLNEKGK